MRDRKGNWTDLFASHALAVDAKKVWLGFIATLGTVAVFALFSFIYNSVEALGGTAGSGNFISVLFRDGCAVAMGMILPLFNPFAAGWLHFVASGVFYLFLLAVWTCCGGAVTRLTALQYARDDIPTLKDAMDMVRKKRKAFFFAPVTPLLAVLLFGLLNQLAGLIGSIPLVGPWILALLIPIGVLPGTIVLTFIVVLGILSFGLMLPSISIGGKDAFEGWSSAYSYLLWGFNRFVSYTALAAVLGMLSVLVAMVLSNLFISLMNATVSIGLIGEELIATGLGAGLFTAPSIPAAEGAVGLRVASWAAVVIAILIRTLVPAYAFSYFFTSNTIICFLMRKHVDRVDVEDVYYEEEDELVENERMEEEEEQGKGGSEEREEIIGSDEGPGAENLAGNINLNSASLEELKNIIHIGDEQARQIIESRPFSSVDELKAIKTIGPTKIENIKKEGRATV